MKNDPVYRPELLAPAGNLETALAAFDGGAETAETISGLILQAASVLGYLFAEGLADSEHGN